MQQSLNRTTFTTSRVMEFFTEKELQMQIGHSRDWWPIALVKELIDNSLDASERAGVSPNITISVERNAVSIQDNGPGLPRATLEKSLDYLVRVSDKAYYVSPTRGQLGNALKCVWAAPFVINGKHGRVDVETAGTRYQIEAQVDFITQKPHISVVEEPSDVKTGTLVKMHWSGIPRFLGYENAPSFYNAPNLWQVLGSYAAFNPNATFAIKADGYHPDDWVATDPGWSKWLPSQPTSPHWYTPDRLRALIAGYLSSDLSNGRSRTIREFISEFAGLSGTAKQKAIADRAGLSGTVLRDMVQGNDVSLVACHDLLAEMRAEARTIKPGALGVLGEQHLRSHMATRRYVQEASIRYKKAEGESDGLPFVIEVCFGVYQRDYQECGRDLAVGLNWSPSISGQPIHDLSTILGEQRIDRIDPVVVLVHIACPRFEYLDRGKTTVSLPGVMKSALADAIAGVTKEWKQAKKKADSNERVRERDLERLRQAQRQEKPTIKDACYRFLEDVYNEVSAHGSYPAPKRMIMYGLRDRVLQIETREPWNHTSTPKYVTQSVIRDFLEDHPELTADWDIVGDDRGHMIEPHTEATIGLGGIAVRRYVRLWKDDFDDSVQDIELDTTCDTTGPANRYQYVLFCEKEGWNEIFKQTQFLEKHGVGMMSTKGMSVEAARELVDELSGRGVTTFVAHDFDKAGFSILGTLQRDSRVYRFKNTPKVINLGLTLDDVHKYGLQGEPVEYTDEKDPRENLQENGATDDESNFLVRRQNYTGKGWIGERVELNAFRSVPRMLEWLGKKLEQHGTEKLIPDDDILARFYRRSVKVAALQEAIDKAKKSLPDDDDIDVPDDLHGWVKDLFDKDDTLSWDAALAQIAQDDVEETE